MTKSRAAPCRAVESTRASQRPICCVLCFVFVFVCDFVGFSWMWVGVGVGEDGGVRVRVRNDPFKTTPSYYLYIFTYPAGHRPRHRLQQRLRRRPPIIAFPSPNFLRPKLLGRPRSSSSFFFFRRRRTNEEKGRRRRRRESPQGVDAGGELFGAQVRDMGTEGLFCFIVVYSGFWLEKMKKRKKEVNRVGLVFEFKKMGGWDLCFFVLGFIPR